MGGDDWRALVYADHYDLPVIAQDEIREALVGVIDPEIRRSVVELDMVRGVDVAGAHVDVTIALTVAGAP